MPSNSPNTMSSARFNAFPMGPHLRAYLGIADSQYQGGVAPRRDDAEIAELTAFLKARHDLVPAGERLAGQKVVDLLDELVSMDLAQAALDVAASHPDDITSIDFRAQLALGVAAMLTGDLVGAEAHLRLAQAALPEEPAPYVNLAQIFLQQDRTDEAEVWLVAGLDAEPNNMGLWDLLADSYQRRYGDFLADKLLALAEKRCSWAGLALAANLTNTGDRYLKANLLDRLYHQGERDPQFLVELTAAHGIAGEFQKIPAIVWQAERLTTTGLPWQLHVHCAQAQLAMGQNDEAKGRLAKARRDPSLPPDAAAALAELVRDIEDGTATTLQ